jgi:hypothetical protein
MTESKTNYYKKYFCEHNKSKYTCKECGGSSLCEHNRRKSTCKECGGSSLCEHNRMKSTCKECGGSGICEHNRMKSTCKECGGSGICEHNRSKYTCKECGGSSLCEHNRQKSTCKECGGSSVCEHNRQKYTCKECGGSSVCEHNRQKSTCITCKPEKACKLCKYVYIHSRSKYKPYCANCYHHLNPDEEIPKRQKTKEIYFDNYLRTTFDTEDVEFKFDRQVDQGCSRRRPDVRIERFTHSIIIECDENQHIGYSCENKRMMEIFQDLGSRPIIFIRFNPDKYTNKEGKQIEGCFRKNKSGYLSIDKKEWSNRCSILKENILMSMKNIPTKEVTKIQLFYNSDCIK